MTALSGNASLREYQDFIREIYDLPDARHFDLWDMLSNTSRFTMRSLKGIRKGDNAKAKFNLCIALSWFMSVANRLKIDIESSVWARFPYSCHYCAARPCACRTDKDTAAKREITGKAPATLEEYQKMFGEIYPAAARTLEHAGVHLAEELGEMSEAILEYRGSHNEDSFDSVVNESADFFSCLMGIFNSLGVSAAAELSAMFSENCHDCHMAPCQCDFSRIISYHS